MKQVALGISIAWVIVLGLGLPAAAAEVPLAGDFDGDGVNDPGVYGDDGVWTIRLSSTGTLARVQFGNPALGDIPITADWDGNGLTDFAVYRQSTGEWFVFLSGRPDLGARQSQKIFFGAAGGDVPAMLDFTGDGVLDVTVYRPSTRTWFLLDGATGEITAVPLAD